MGMRMGVARGPSGGSAHWHFGTAKKCKTLRIFVLLQIKSDFLGSLKMDVTAICELSQRVKSP
jgi:hypothetical protein